jgi:hypothetical protein
MGLELHPKRQSTNYPTPTTTRKKKKKKKRAGRRSVLLLLLLLLLLSPPKRVAARTAGTVGTAGFAAESWAVAVAAGPEVPQAEFGTIQRLPPQQRLLPHFGELQRATVALAPRHLEEAQPAAIAGRFQQMPPRRCSRYHHRHHWQGAQPLDLPVRR